MHFRELQGRRNASIAHHFELNDTATLVNEEMVAFRRSLAPRTNWQLQIGDRVCCGFNHRVSLSTNARRNRSCGQMIVNLRNREPQLRVSRALLLCLGYGLCSLFATWFPVVVS
ncbi:MAG TPA: hypothetical protein PLR25_23295, partial [Planctomycetaceae bacterium]|nr:hypothetical protein [Planctomycetaceae bacterium]